MSVADLLQTVQIFWLPNISRGLAAITEVPRELAEIGFTRITKHRLGL
jgi:hypothetical protein